MPSAKKTGSVVALGGALSAPVWVPRVVSLPGTIDDLGAWMNMLPWYAWGGLVAVSGVWVGVAWANDMLRLFRPNWPNFKEWDQRQDFELYEAACLWFNQEPQLPMPRRAKKVYEKWREKIYDRALAANTETMRASINLAFERTGLAHERMSVTPHNKISREDLIGLAREGECQPEFLFPHKRGE